MPICARKSMKKYFKKIICFMLAIALVLTSFPLGRTEEVKAATTTASFRNLGNLGTVKITDSKSESGMWKQTKVTDNVTDSSKPKVVPVFCLNLGLACNSGDVYENESGTYSSADSNKKIAMEAKIGYWFSQVKKNSTKAWVYAQCLIWLEEETKGSATEAQLKDIIRQVKNNTKYYNDKDVNEIYKEIFDISDIVTCDIIKWKYSAGDKYKRQVLLQINTTEVINPTYEPLENDRVYRQRITLTKYDEDGNVVPHAWFNVKASNMKEMTNYKVVGFGEEQNIDTDGESVFDVDAQTDANGKLTYKFTYRLQSKTYGYVKDSSIKDLTKEQKEDYIKNAKAQMDEEGIEYSYDCSKEGAQTLVNNDLDSQYGQISNTYTVQELKVENGNLVVDEQYGKGVDYVLTSADSWTKVDGKWPDTQGDASDSFGNYILARKIDVTNNFKKVSISVNKFDAYSNDRVAHGDATLDGAVFGIYADSACTVPATVYSPTGKAITARPYSTTNKTFITDYLRAGETYYVKEIEPPYGYKLSSQVLTIKPNGDDFTVEYNNNGYQFEYGNNPIFGQIEITKIISDGTTGPAKYEEGATFQLYRKAAGSYNNASDYDRDTLITNDKGYAISKKLYIGTYILHQTGTGNEDTEMIADQEVQITQDGQIIPLMYNNAPFSAYLRVIKKDGNTKATVLKENTSYNIYKVNKDDSETKVVQSYSNGKKIINIDTYVSDNTGEIMTVKPLKSGTYRIYEIDSATGLYIKHKFIEITINSKTTTYEKQKDAEGNTISIVTLEYENDEAKGKFTVEKTGKVLTKVDKETTDTSNEEESTINESTTDKATEETTKNESETTVQSITNEDNKVDTTENIKDFVYETANLSAEFKVYAAKDIETQDGQGTYWFKKGDLVATITTNKGAEFTDECYGICSYTVDEKTGAVTLTLPLGEYTMKETKAPYGHVISSKEWPLKFEWKNKDTEFVEDSAGTCEDGILKVNDKKVKANVKITKKDKKDSALTVPNTKFGFYTKNDIYSTNGDLLVKADSLLTTVTTNEKGVAKIDMDLPLMDENYEPGSKLNSGEYYFIEMDISNSYYIDKTPIEIKLESKDQNVETIESNSTQENIRTESVFSKKTLTGTDELQNCYLTITDENNNEIISWISGDKSSVKISDKLKDLGYENVEAAITDNGNLEVKGLLHDTVYYMTETKPADGYTTAERISFKLIKNVENSDKDTYVYVEKTTPTSSVDDENVLTMKDDVTSVALSKMDIAQSKEIPGCSLRIEDENGKIIEDWISTEERHIITAKLGINKVYKLIELRPADGYASASEITFKVNDTNEVQSVVMKDDTTKVQISKTDITGTKEIPGCSLTLTDKAGNLIDSWVSGDTPHFIENKLIVGNTYTLTETQPAEGCVTASSIDFIVNDGGQIQTVNMKDEVTNVHISKKDITTEDEIPGCHLTLKEKDGNVVEEWVSTNKPHVITQKLVINRKYELIEKYPADGYARANKITFKVADTGEIQSVVMHDATTKVEFNKIASDTKKQLKGAEYEVYDSNGKKVYEFTTGKKATLIEGLFIVGETYTFKEAKAPKNYKLTKDVKIKIKDTGKVQKLEATDERIHNNPVTGIMVNPFIPLILLIGVGLVVRGFIVVRKKENA